MSEAVSIAFTGDIAFDKYMYGKWNDPDLISQEVLDFLHSATHVVANVEGPLVRLEDDVSKTGVAQLLHAMDPDATIVFDRMQANIWNLCNNHIMDAGEEGVRETLRIAAEHKVMTMGAGMNLEEAKKPLYFPEAGGIGMFAVGYRRGCKPADKDKAGCFLWHEMELIEETIKSIKENNRWCVVVCHGGEEFTALPSPYTRERFHKYLEMGADIVVCHHPHVPMNYETVGDKTIFYSLGNFIFDTDYQRAQFNTELGLLVKINFTEDSYTWDAMGIEINREEGRIIKGEIPRIFTDVQEEEYKLLAPLAAKMMVSAYKRQLVYLQPDKYSTETTEEKWRENFLAEVRSGRVIGEGLDFHIIYPLAEEAAKGAWEKSKLDAVKAYILEQI